MVAMVKSPWTALLVISASLFVADCGGSGETRATSPAASQSSALSTTEAPSPPLSAFDPLRYTEGIPPVTEPDSPSSDRAPSRWGDSLLVQVEHPPAPYVLGYPIHVSVSVRAQAAVGFSVRPRPVAEQFEERDSGSVKYAFPSSFGGEGWPGRGGSSIAFEKGEVRRYLFDLSERFAFSGFEAFEVGKVYRLRLRFYEVEAQPVEVEFRAPTPSERAEVERLRAGPGFSGTWGDWSRAPVEAAAAGSATILPSDPLRYEKVLRYLCAGPTEPQNIPARWLDVLDGFHARDAELLRVDLAYARGDKIAAEREGSRVRDAYPELSWVVRDIESGGSEVARCRAFQVEARVRP